MVAVLHLYSTVAQLWLVFFFFLVFGPPAAIAARAGELEELSVAGSWWASALCSRFSK